MKLKTARPVARVRQGQGQPEWYRIAKTRRDVADIAIYADIGDFGITAGDFRAELKALDVQQINVRINSAGGDVWDGLAIYNSLRDHPAKVTTYVDGLAASAASIIVQAGDRRVAAKASEVMIHEAWVGVIGNAAELRETADRLDQASAMIAEVYADRAGGTVDQWREAMRAESSYTGTEAASIGLVDEVDGVLPGAPQAKAPAPPAPPIEPEPELVFDAEAFSLGMKEACNA